MILQNEASGPGRDPETTLFAQAQAGCRQSLNALMQQHEGLMHLVVQRQWLLTLPDEGAREAGRRCIVAGDFGLRTWAGSKLCDLRLHGHYEVCLGGCKG